MNPVLLLRDLLIETYGVENVDVASFEAAAKYCEELVDVPSPTSRWTYMPGKVV